MLTELHFSHRDHTSPGQVPILAHQAVSWKTCLRELIFVRQKSQLILLPGNHYSGVEAYQFLLQLICGLHSPLIGETEVFSQFKQFVQQHPRCLPEKLVQSLIKDTKKLRTAYLTNFGGQSYGSYTLNQSKGMNSIVLIGSGHLSNEILAITKKFKGELVVQARCPRKAEVLQNRYPQLVLEHLSSPGQARHRALVVVAAPMASDQLTNHLHQSFSHSKVLDMRALGHHPPLSLHEHFEVQNLALIFERIKKVQQDMQAIATIIKEKISELAQRQEQQLITRPFGWEDLCS